LGGRWGESVIREDMIASTNKLKISIITFKPVSAYLRYISYLKILPLVSTESFFKNALKLEGYSS